MDKSDGDGDDDGDGDSVSYLTRTRVVCCRNCGTLFSRGSKLAEVQGRESNDGQILRDVVSKEIVWGSVGVLPTLL